ncbi:MAG TPA: class I SAM-dependent methyltransferase [Thermoanaerobaculia bacterium]|nr:class I SAM-dependent methyltransferase [Thermoanaerobaculia bacterium]
MSRTLLISWSLAGLAALSLACSDSAADAAAGLEPPAAVAEVAGPPLTIDFAKRDVPYVPTPQPVVDRMLELAEVGPDDLLYDLGSGDGRIVIAAARRGARGVGIDIDPERIAEANGNAEQAGVTDRVRFVEGDLFEADVHDATAVTLYLLRSVNRRLRPRLLEQLRPGTPIVSHDFDMTEWTPDAYEKLGRSEIYLWIVPAKVDGRWSWKGPDGREQTVLVEQEFQKLTAEANDAEIDEPLLRGDRISFVLRTHDGRSVQRYEGTVKGTLIEGRVSLDGGPFAPWRAVIAS